ncbi:glycosyltransferase family 25 protein [Methylovulum psychrotolerans]|jgi:GR25 family glycosyltransferase involved in LPS biosynthesis|nr:glycosyltransferase family 25 protein [Methylovulum psychrotolerans]
MKIGKYVIGFSNSKRIELFFERNLQLSGFEQVEAINGKAMPFSLTLRLFKKDFVDHQLSRNSASWLQGTLGCLLSHIKAIEQAQNDDVDYALIVEDDAVFRATPDEIFVVARNQNYDIVYINDRMSLDRLFLVNGEYTISDLTASNLKGTGAEAYIVSRKAMPVLLDLFTSAIANGLPCGYDGFLQSIVLKQSDYEKTPNALDDRPGKKGLLKWLAFRKIDLNVGVSSPTLVKHVDDGKSLIRD